MASHRSLIEAASKPLRQNRNMAASSAASRSNSLGRPVTAIVVPLPVFPWPFFLYRMTNKSLDATDQEPKYFCVDHYRNGDYDDTDGKTGSGDRSQQRYRRSDRKSTCRRRRRCCDHL